MKAMAVGGEASGGERKMEALRQYGGGRSGAIKTPLACVILLAPSFLHLSLSSLPLSLPIPPLPSSSPFASPFLPRFPHSPHSGVPPLSNNPSSSSSTLFPPPALPPFLFILCPLFPLRLVRSSLIYLKEKSFYPLLLHTIVHTTPSDPRSALSPQSPVSLAWPGPRGVHLPAAALLRLPSQHFVLAFPSVSITHMPPVTSSPQWLAFRFATPANRSFIREFNCLSSRLFFFFCYIPSFSLFFVGVANFSFLLLLLL